MQTRDITVHLIASSEPDYPAIKEWLDDVGADGGGITAQLMSADGSSDQDTIVALAGKRCYNSFQPGLNVNVTKVTDLTVDLDKYLEGLLSSGHGSVLEHVSYTFAIEGVTRVFTGEMNRHRAGVAISEGSMRYIRMDNLSYWLPHSIHLRGNSLVEDDKRKETRRIFEEVFTHVEAAYATLCRIWNIDSLPFEEKKKLTSMFRRIIPMGVCTGGVWTLNLRALRHMLTIRSTPAAEEEIRHVAYLMFEAVRERELHLLVDFETSSGYLKPKYVKV